MDLKNLESVFIDHGCKKIFVKVLSPNDNSKNQVYLGGSFELLNVFPLSKIVTEAAGDWNRERFKASINFYWINDEGNIFPAPNSQLILYPKYPEVRFSGFLSRCQNPPSFLMTQRLQGRILFLGVTDRGTVLGYVTGPESNIAKEFEKTESLQDYGVFKVRELTSLNYSKEMLLSELTRIHDKGWIVSKRLNSAGDIIPCDAPQCGGYTLEAELGIIPNGYAEPDFYGWEMKQFNVTNFGRINSAVITLMTPEPTGGIYVSKGVEAFIRYYGYKDLMGRSDRLNFGGVHSNNIRHKRTGLTLVLDGFDSSSGKIKSVEGRIVLIDDFDIEAASWNFSSLLLHWNRKHHLACYVPSQSEKNETRSYLFGDRVVLGIGTDFHLFLQQLSKGNIYYDPGIKMEDESSHPKIKRRSQFRIKSGNIPNLYHKSEVVFL